MQALLRELRERVRHAHESRTPLRLRGAGTKDFYGERCEGQLLELHGYAGVLAYEPAELVLTARCGTRLSEIEALLAAQRQFLAFEPPALGGDPTIGGIVAAGLSGPRRARAGAARDFVLGTLLLGCDGELLHFGGTVMKNVAGFDVSRLLCGSLGILGPVLEVSLKVLPLPPAQQTLRFEMAEGEALAAFNRWAGQPLPLCATAWFDGQAWVRLSGAASAVRASAQQLGGERIESEPAAAFWRSARDQTHPLLSRAASLWRLSLPSTAAPLSLAPPAAQLIEWGGALRWCATDRPAAEMRAIAAAAGGSAMHWRGGASGSRFHPLAPPVLELPRRLKARFDPHGIFNPGRLVAEL